MDQAERDRLIDYLRTFVTPAKFEKMEMVLRNRTRHVTVVLEDIFQANNANAVMRSSECYGIQDVYVVEDRFRFTVTGTVAMGSTKWLTINKYNSSVDCLKYLKSQGYRLVATTPDPDAIELEHLPLDTKLALVFGTENSGLTADALALCDERMVIPMYGFTQSFNVSVSVALSLQHIITQLHKSHIAWQLTVAQQQDILLQWLRATVRASDLLEARFLNNQ